MPVCNVSYRAVLVQEENPSWALNEKVKPVVFNKAIAFYAGQLQYSKPLNLSLPCLLFTFLCTATVSSLCGFW